MSFSPILELSLGLAAGQSWLLACSIPELMSQLLLGEPGLASQLFLQWWFGRSVHITNVKKKVDLVGKIVFLALTQVGFIYSG